MRVLLLAGFAIWVLPWLVLGCQAIEGGRPNQAGLAGPQGFGPERVIITPLTELAGPVDKAGIRQIRVFVKVVDGFGCDMKAPGVFRFELYQMLPRSAEQRGSRLAIWPDIDLTDPARNHQYWHQILRMYIFSLDLAVGTEGPYVLECTLMCPDGRRLSGQYLLAWSR